MYRNYNSSFFLNEYFIRILYFLGKEDFHIFEAAKYI